MKPNELLDVTAYGLRSDFLSPETMPKATVELALTKNRKLLLASVLYGVVCPALSQGTKIQNLRYDNKTLKEMIGFISNFSTLRAIDQRKTVLIEVSRAISENKRTIG